jgi:hypothetical protein
VEGAENFYSDQPLTCVFLPPFLFLLLGVKHRSQAATITSPAADSKRHSKKATREAPRDRQQTKKKKKKKKETSTGSS